MSRDLINTLGAQLQALRHGDDLIVSFGAHGPSYDCRNGSMTCTLRRGKDEATSEAVSLYDAMTLAEAKLDAMAPKRAKALVEGRP